MVLNPCSHSPFIYWVVIICFLYLLTIMTIGISLQINIRILPHCPLQMSKGTITLMFINPWQDRVSGCVSLCSFKDFQHTSGLPQSSGNFPSFHHWYQFSKCLKFYLCFWRPSSTHSQKLCPWWTSLNVLEATSGSNAVTGKGAILILLVPMNQFVFQCPLLKHKINQHLDSIQEFSSSGMSSSELISISSSLDEIFIHLNEKECAHLAADGGGFHGMESSPTFPGGSNGCFDAGFTNVFKTHAQHWLPNVTGFGSCQFYAVFMWGMCGIIKTSVILVGKGFIHVRN